MKDGIPQRYEQIVELLLGVQKQLACYLRALVSNHTDAEEVLQETNLFIWRHADEYELGTNFPAWACKIAYYQVLNHRKRQRRAGLHFSDVLVKQLASTVARNPGWPSDDLEAFEQCFDRLPERDRELLHLRYEPDATVSSIARRLGRTTAAVYKALGRSRTWLIECMERSLSGGGGT